MNYPPANAIEIVRGNVLILGEFLKRRTKRQDQPNPNSDGCGIRDQIPNNDGIDETLFQTRRNQQGINYGHIVPNVERASDEMRNQWRECSNQQRMSLQGTVHGLK